MLVVAISALILTEPVDHLPRTGVDTVTHSVRFAVSFQRDVSGVSFELRRDAAISIAPAARYWRERVAAGEVWRFEVDFTTALRTGRFCVPIEVRVAGDPSALVRSWDSLEGVVDKPCAIGKPR